jgi:ribosomal-protein-alanine N-acetyltransferase
METIVTERLILEDFRMDFLSDFYEYAKVEGVGEKAGWPHHASLEESKKILGNFLVSKENYAICDKKTGKCIGSLGVSEHSDLVQSFAFSHDFPSQRGIELGYVLNKDYWGRGLMTEAVSKVIDFLFTKDKTDVLVIDHFDFNKASKRVIEKCGFHYWYTVKDKPIVQLNKHYDTLCYFLTKEEYLDNQK